MIRVLLGDLATVEADAVVRPIRSDLAPVSGLSRDLGVGAGEQVEERLSRLGTLPLGGATLTPGGDLPSDFLIHIVVMSEDEPQTSATVQKALLNGLRRAVDMGIGSLALPPVGLGVGLVEPEESAQTLIAILLNHLDEGRPPHELTIVVTSPFEEQLFSGLLEAAVQEREG